MINEFSLVYVGAGSQQHLDGGVARVDHGVLYTDVQRRLSVLVRFVQIGP